MVQRFIALARALQVDHLAVIATAAVREAQRRRRLRRRDRAPQRGRGADHRRRRGGAAVGHGRVGRHPGGGWCGRRSRRRQRRTWCRSRVAAAGRLSAPASPCRWGRCGWPNSATTARRRPTRSTACWPMCRYLRAVAGKTLYLVGGAWRAIARLHMEQVRYPLHIIHQYTIPRAQVDGFLDLVARLSRRSLEQITTINRKRLEVVPPAASILRRLIAVGRPERVTFSSLRSARGLCHRAVAGRASGRPADRGLCRDPPKARAGCAATAIGFNSGPRRCFRPCRPRRGGFTARPAGSATSPGASTRTIAPSTPSCAACACRSVRSTTPSACSSLRPCTRAMAAPPTIRSARRPRCCSTDRAAGEARILGLTLRLAYTLCGGALDLLADVRLVREADALILELPIAGRLLLAKRCSAASTCSAAPSASLSARCATRSASPGAGLTGPFRPLLVAAQRD